MHLGDVLGYRCLRGCEGSEGVRGVCEGVCGSSRRGRRGSDGLEEVCGMGRGVRSRRGESEGVGWVGGGVMGGRGCEESEASAGRAERVGAVYHVIEISIVDDFIVLRIL